MTTRREFLKHAAAAGAIVATSAQAAKADKIAHTSGARIKSVVRREETTLRLGGTGDNFHMSWADDDRQYVSVCDGAGWFDPPKANYNSRLFAIEGGPRGATFHDVPGYPDLVNVINTDRFSRYYNFGTLALDGHIYQYLSTPNHPFHQPQPRFVGAKIIYSPDNGRTWRNQDGSTPVAWEPWERRSRRNMVFFEESQDAFSLLTVLQMGRNYAANTDGYVYVYAPNGNTEGTMNELVMFRVPKAQLLNRGAYEYFAGLKAGGGATWVKDIDARAAVHTFPRGWVNTAIHPYAWHPSVVYNAPLRLYLMANWGMGNAPDGLWFGKPSYLGFWSAPHPWGPWTQIHEETAWTPGNDRAARAYAPQIAPKWIAADGKSFWIVWTDFQIANQEAVQRVREEMKRTATPTPEDERRWMLEKRHYQPYYAFNAQRVDLDLFDNIAPALADMRLGFGNERK